MERINFTLSSARDDGDAAAPDLGRRLQLNVLRRRTSAKIRGRAQAHAGDTVALDDL